MKKVLFVCTGNTCRSPMAEALFNHYTKNNSDLSASSCGLYGDGISQISDNAKLALKEKGIEFSHTSTPISKELIDSSDCIIGITANHARSIISQYPESGSKVYAMPYDIADPFGLGIVEYRKCLDEIDKAVKSLITTLSGENDG